MNLNEPTAAEFREKFRTRCVQDEAIGVPKGIARAKFGDTDASLQKTIASGKHKAIEMDGQTFYSWREIRVGEKFATHVKHQISKSRQISDEDDKKATKILESLQWNFKYTAIQNKEAEEGQGLPEHIVDKSVLYVTQ